MKVKITYVDFHWDNYQGGSGKSFEFLIFITIPDETLVGAIYDLIMSKLEEKIIRERPFKQDNKWSVTRIEVV